MCQAYLMGGLPTPQWGAGHYQRRLMSTAMMGTAGKWSSWQVEHEVLLAAVLHFINSGLILPLVVIQLSFLTGPCAAGVECRINSGKHAGGALGADKGSGSPIAVSARLTGVLPMLHLAVQPATWNASGLLAPVLLWQDCCWLPPGPARPACLHDNDCPPPGWALKAHCQCPGAACPLTCVRPPLPTRSVDLLCLLALYVLDA